MLDRNGIGAAARAKRMAFVLAAAILALVLAPMAHAKQAVLDTGSIVPSAYEAVETWAFQAQGTNASSLFSEDVELIDGRGNKSSITCMFAITSENTCGISGDGTDKGTKAVDDETSGTITIPESVTYDGKEYAVTEVCDYAFGSTDVENSCTKLSAVVLPKTVTSIGKYSFAHCMGLVQASLPSSLASIGDHGFYFCTGLTDLSMPSSLKTLATYSFCQCNGLSKVVFEGDLPTMGNYCFTGGTTIKTVAFYGTSLNSQDSATLHKYFNSDTVSLPSFYFSVVFYGSSYNATAKKGELGRVVVKQGTRLSRINAKLISNDIIYFGAVPNYPSNTNVWNFSDGAGGTVLRHKTLTSSTVAWASSSDCFDLTKDSAAMPNCNYTAEPMTPEDSRIGAYLSITDTMNTILEDGVDYRVDYQRQDSSGVWTDTADLTNPGSIRMVITGEGEYAGTIYSTFEIAFKPGVVFTIDVPLVTNGKKTTVKCAFKLLSLDNGVGMLEVSQRQRTKDEMIGHVTTRAVPIRTVGDIEIPQTVSLFGNTLTVTQVGASAFGFSDPYDASACTGLTAVTLPSTITMIGTSAFNRCTGIQKFVFKGDLDGATIGTDIADGCTALSKVVFFGKRPDDTKYNLDKLFPSKPSYYYTITFYASKDAKANGASPLGSITLKSGYLLVNIPDKPTDQSIVYSGKVPDYPSDLIDDHSNPSRSWYAPAWLYPGVDPDNTVALKSGMTDSVDAYASQMQDAFTIDDAIVFGLDKNAELDCTGSDVISPDDLTVYSALGGTLVRGVDYTLEFQRRDEDGNWVDTADMVSAGYLKLIIRGKGKYASETRIQEIPFSIATHELAENSVFAADVGLVTPSGVQTTAKVRFKVTKEGDNPTVAVLGNSSNIWETDSISAVAIDSGITGTLSIPGTLEYRGLSYTVTALESYCFAKCSLTGIVIPSTVTSIGNWSMRGCSYLESIDIPGSVDTIALGACKQCTSLKNAVIEEGVTRLGTEMFASCSSLESVSIPSSLNTIASNCFNGCSSLASIEIPPALTSYESAFANSGLKSVTIDEGATAVPAKAFEGCSQLAEAKLPSTLQSIGSAAFCQSGITLLSLPASVASIGSKALYGCTKLSTVIFEGDPEGIAVSNDTFAVCGGISKVVYRESPLVTPSLMFPALSSNASFYSEVTFYASADDMAAGKPCGQAAIKHGTQLRLIASGQFSSGLVFDGSVPAYPEGSNSWVFAGGLSLGSTLSDSVAAYARQADLADISYGQVALSGSYRHTGSSCDPFVDGTGLVVNASGKVLIRNTDYTIEYQRLKNGAWTSTNNKTSLGTIRIVARAIEGSSYTGAVMGYYSITDYMPGDTFTAKDASDNVITYKVLAAATSATPGKVQVGIGGTGAASANQAVSDTTAISGDLVIPDTVSDPAGSSYDVTIVAPYAFYRCMGVTSVTFPSSIERIGAYSFAYQKEKTDTKTSGIKTIVFNNDLSKTRVGHDVFLGCDIVSTIVYGQKKGTFEAKYPFSPKAGITPVRYYTARYYDSAEAAAQGAAPLATCVVKEGAYLYSVSNADYRAGSDKAPDAADGYEWAYDSSALDADGRIIDSQDICSYQMPDNTVVANIACTTGSVKSQIPCTFTILTKPANGAAGTVCVGRLEDGKPAVDSSTAGALVVPSSIQFQGQRYDVVEIGDYAFGSSEQDKACASIDGIAIPASVKAIDAAAFAGCASLASVDLGDAATLSTIGSSAFSGCTSLASFDFSETIRSIQDGAFAGSGLEKVVLPPSLSSLGKKAFSGCASLREVVFAGPMRLELPAIAGTDLPEGSQYPGFANDMALEVLDDYTFSNCARLERVVFEQNAAGLAISNVAFEGSYNVGSVVFGGSKAAISLYSDSSLTPAKFDTYYTISYFATEDDQAALKRSGYQVLLAGAVPATPAQGDLLVGSQPELAAYHEWVRTYDPAVPLEDSASAYGRRITYALGVAADVDPIFTVDFTVDGSSASDAGFGDEVSATVSSAGAPQVTGFSVADASGNIVFKCDSATGSFSMPGSAIKLSVSYACGLEVDVTKATAAGTETKEYDVTVGQMEELAKHAGGDAYYSAYDALRNPQVYRSDRWVGIEDLLADLGIRFDAGDSLIVSSSSTGQSFSISYDELCASERSFYPGIGTDDPDNPVASSPALCLRSAYANATTISGPDALAPSMAQCYQFCYGQTSDDFSVMRNTWKHQVTQVDKITVLYGAEDVSACTISGLDSSYCYTGEEIKPEIVLADIDGNTMVEGTDYAVKYESNINAGKATVTVTGIGRYAGEKSAKYAIIRAQGIAGESRMATAAAISEDAYPDECDGAIVATASSFPDALSAASLAGAMGYPILLTSPDTLSPEAEDAISALSAGKDSFSIIVVGGEGAVSNDVYAKLSAYATYQGARNDNYIMRLSGADRYDTSLVIYDYGKAAGLWSDTAILVSAQNYPDALSIAPYAAYSQSPIILCAPTKLFDDASSRIKSGGFKRIIIAGGEGAVGAEVEKAAADIVGESRVTRLSGDNRYATCIAIARWSIAQGMSCDGCAIATGESFPDALAGGPMLGKSGSVLLLVSPGNESALALLGENKDSVTLVRFLGGTFAVTQQMRLDALSQLSWSEGALS